jgi:CheY-like chemotaxis protein
LLTGINILVAEDNSLNQKIASYVLQKQGASVVFASNGREAIDYLNKGNFDIILMDIQMPVMDGYATARYIRTDLKNNIPIVACTASSFSDETRECLEAGMDACITKPFEMRSLCEMILNLIKERKQ